jgi:enoyl-CoA hydratase
LLIEVSSSEDIRAVVIWGGDRGVFCAGADLKERLRNPGRDYELRRPIVSVWQTLHRFPKALVFAVNGHAIGGGFELIVHGDAVIASETAEFLLPELEWAGIPGGWATQLLPRFLGPVLARWLILSGTRLSAEEVRRLGLVTAVTAPNAVLPRAVAAAQRLAGRPLGAVAIAKEAIRQSFDIPLSAGTQAEDYLLQIATAAPERLERLKAFASGKRP